MTTQTTLFFFFFLVRLVVRFIRPRLRRLHEYQNTEMTRRWVGGNAHGLVWASIYLPHPNDKQRIPYWAVKRRPSWKHFLNRESRGTRRNILRPDGTRQITTMEWLTSIESSQMLRGLLSLHVGHLFFYHCFFKALLGSSSIQKVIISRTDA